MTGSAKQSISQLAEAWIASSAEFIIGPAEGRTRWLLAMTESAYFALPRLSKNTPCSPNMFQNHQGRLSLKGRP
ncbi:hypothetical protein SAMN05443247_00256 [Bradyrhizobium erythrophlei]|nr:hypothetical protein SAMN05443247_00256 [Bradyrhizobium erythrophlei]